jgi:predicted acetyltransferase
MRHYLNEKLRDHGGHIGYYIRKDCRGRGYARTALRQVLAEFSKLGERRAMLTVNLDNLASIRVIEACGGVLESTGQEENGDRFGRYWIDLNTVQPGKE